MSTNPTYAVLSLGNNAFGQCGRSFVDNEEYFPNFNVHQIEGIDEPVEEVGLLDFFASK
jgi:hypothetical protein